MWQYIRGFLHHSKPIRQEYQESSVKGEGCTGKYLIQYIFSLCGFFQRVRRVKNLMAESIECDRWTKSPSHTWIDKWKPGDVPLFVFHAVIGFLYTTCTGIYTTLVDGWGWRINPGRRIRVNERTKKLSLRSFLSCKSQYSLCEILMSRKELHWVTKYPPSRIKVTTTTWRSGFLWGHDK